MSTDTVAQHGDAAKRPSRRGVLRISLYYALFLAPAASVAPLDASYVYWLAGSVALATAVRWLWEGHRLPRRCAALALNSATVLANVLLMVSLHVQGAGFNPKFFFHVSWETLAIASQALAPAFFGCWIYWLVVSCWPAALPRPNRAARRSGAIAAALALGFALNAPLLSFGWYVAKDSLDARSALLVPKPPTAAHPAQPSDDPPDLILIFAEALEDTFNETWPFGMAMTPRLNALADEGLRFRNMRQVSYTSWTAGGMVAALCAMPVITLAPSAGFERLVGRVSFDARVPGATCLGDVLRARGYATAYMGGAPLAFAGKGEFLAEHGFSTRHGRTTLTPRLKDPAYLSAWGLFDDALLTLVTDELAALDAGDAPFALTLLTLDTHSPVGYPSASCRAGASSDADVPNGSAPSLSEAERDFLRIVQCSDRLLAKFIQDARARYPNALIALFSDHLIPFDSVLSRRFTPREDERRLRFVLWGPGIAAGAVDRPGTHFDVMPTLLDSLGFHTWAEHNLGTSLLRQGSPWLSHPNPYALRVTHHLQGVRLAPGHAVTFDVAGPSIELGDATVLATNRGLRLVDGVFALVLDGRGGVVGIGQFPVANGAANTAPGDWAADWAAGRAIVGVSNNEAFNRGLLEGAPPKLMYFAGRPNTDAFIAGELTAKHTVKVSLGR